MANTYGVSPGASLREALHVNAIGIRINSCKICRFFHDPFYQKIHLMPEIIYHHTFFYDPEFSVEIICFGHGIGMPIVPGVHKILGQNLDPIKLAHAVRTISHMAQGAVAMGFNINGE